MKYNDDEMDSEYDSKYDEESSRSETTEGCLKH
jgi:hypothetical protein